MLQLGPPRNQGAMWVCNLDLDLRVSDMFAQNSEQRIDKPHMHVDCASSFAWRSEKVEVDSHPL